MINFLFINYINIFYPDVTFDDHIYSRLNEIHNISNLTKDELILLKCLIGEIS